MTQRDLETPAGAPPAGDVERARESAYRSGYRSGFMVERPVRAQFLPQRAQYHATQAGHEGTVDLPPKTGRSGHKIAA
jgi:hypothetical protein